MVRLARVEPILKLIGEGRVGPVAADGHGGQVAVLGQFFLLLGQRLLGAQELELREVLVEPGEGGHVDLLYVGLLHGDGLVGRIVDHILQHVVLLGEHGLGVVVLHAEVLEVHVDALHIHAERHVVVVESLGDVAQLLQSLDVVLDDAYLLLGVLREVIHLADLHDKVLLGLGVR